MIKLEAITIREFRGIRDLTLEFKCGNFAVCGPNGTGKSGIVDALEFGLTGTVSRLSGEGRGDISLKEHGPHVDSSHNPERAQVSVTVTIPNLKKTFTIIRTVDAPASPVIQPRDPVCLALVKMLELHPEIVLSRRELIRYVLATPGQRAEEVQALLHLDKLAKVRAVLFKIANSTKKAKENSDANATIGRTNLVTALGITDFKKENILRATNAQRQIWGLAPLMEMTETTSLREGLVAPTPNQGARIVKAQALQEITLARKLLAELSSPASAKQIAVAETKLEALDKDPLIAQGMGRANFYTTGLKLVEGEFCPLCDTSWNPGELKRHLQQKIDALKETERNRKAAEALVEPIISQLGKLKGAVDLVCRHAALAKPPVAMNAAREYLSSCAKSSESLGELLPLRNSILALAQIATVPQSILDELLAFETLVKALPEPSKQEAARDGLLLAQTRLEDWRKAMRAAVTAREQADRAKLVYDIYCAKSDAVLSGMYHTVEQQFASLYGFINRADEDKFAAKLIPSLGKLGFDVDFYGRGFFPPGAYHSEGHQDSMGLCLYLALMRHLQGDSFTFAVLDDVLMSVDAGHRREVCALLKQHFPSTQFIITTHDPIWLRHMKTERLIEGRAAIQFRGWSVDEGPTQWDDRDVWTELADHLKANDVRAAAALLRNYLEYTAAELCHRLRAPVEYRGDAQYQLGELMPAAISHLKKLYREGKSAAATWGQKEDVQKFEAKEAAFGKLVEATNAEQWQTNAAIHYNSWATLDKADFEPVVASFRALLSAFCCGDCGCFLRVSPERETRELLRCDCGKTSVNFRRKPQEKKSEPATQKLGAQPSATAAEARNREAGKPPFAPAKHST